MAEFSGRPRISLVIPTYNRCRLLEKTLERLTHQTLPLEEFEVVVADDGSSDATREVVESFAGRLRVVYAFQEDLGFRVAAARNLGARAASAPVLAFLDSGAQPGPELLARHLAAHEGEVHHAVVGYTHGYNPEVPRPELTEALEAYLPEEIFAQRSQDPSFVDIRTSLLAGPDGDINSRLVPFQLFWTGNCSLRADDFEALGGFDTDFEGWGGEDLEMGFRIAESGMPFRAVPEAWVIEVPHDRNLEEHWAQFTVNIGLFLAKHPVPMVELGTVLIRAFRFWDWDAEARALEAERGRVHGLDVSADVAAALRDLGAGVSVAVIGCGPTLPPELPASAILVDFDADDLRSAAAGGHAAHHAIGFRTQLADQSVDVVVLTRRLAGLWPAWGAELTAEAQRVGRKVLILADTRSDPSPTVWESA